MFDTETRLTESPHRNEKKQQKNARFWDNITLIWNPQYTKSDIVTFKLLDFLLALKLNRSIESSTLVTSIMYQSDVKV